MAEWLRLVVDSLVTWVLIAHGAEPFCSAAAILRGTEPVSAQTPALFYIAALSIICFFGFRQWRSRTDRVLALNMNIRFPLFWSTRSHALGPDSATYAGLAHGRDYSDCRASEIKLQKCLATVFLELSKILLNNWIGTAVLSLILRIYD